MAFWDDWFKSTDAKKQRSKTIRISRVRTLIDPTLNYPQALGGGRWSGDGFNVPEYNFLEIGQAEDTESYVMQAHLKKLALMFKEGFDFVGQDEQSVQYILKRISQIERACCHSFWNLLVGVGHDLIRYSNSFMVKVRKEFDNKGRPVSGGLVRTTPDGKKLEPIAAYFRLSPETVEIKRNKSNGKVERYRQVMPDGSKKEYPAHDVIHFHFNRKGHFDVGTPSIIPVLDDIRALRRIEQNVEILVYQHLFPLYQYTVGTEDAPAQVYTDGESEIDLVRKEIEMLPAEGMLVTPERHEIKPVGAEGSALKVEGYLEHFKKRIIAGLGVSAVDFGDGNTANRATADNMSRLLIDNVKFYQQVLSDQIKTFVLDELLLESTFDGDKLSLDRAVRHRFNEIDTEQQIKVDTHASLMYQSNVWTLNEARERMNRNPLSPGDESDLHLEKVEKSMLQETARLAPSPAAGSSSDDPAKKATATKTRPSNQHGTKSGPEKKRSFVDMGLGEQFDEIRDDVISLIKRDGDRLNQGLIRQTILAGATASKQEYKSKVFNAMVRGARAGGLSHSDAEQLVGRRMTPMITRFDSDIDRLYRQVSHLIGNLVSQRGDKSPEVRLAFNSLRYRTKFIAATDMHRAENFGKGIAMNALGHEVAISTQHSDEDDICKERHGQEIQLLALGIDEVPPYHPMCQCDLTPKRTDD